MKKYLITASVLLMSGTSALAAPAGVSTAMDACCAAIAACCEALLSCCG